MSRSNYPPHPHQHQQQLNARPPLPPGPRNSRPPSPSHEPQRFPGPGGSSNGGGANYNRPPPQQFQPNYHQQHPHHQSAPHYHPGHPPPHHYPPHHNNFGPPPGNQFGTFHQVPPPPHHHHQVQQQQQQRYDGRPPLPPPINHYQQQGGGGGGFGNGQNIPTGPRQRYDRDREREKERERDEKKRHREKDNEKRRRSRSRSRSRDRSRSRSRSRSPRERRSGKDRERSRSRDRDRERERDRNRDRDRRRSKERRRERDRSRSRSRDRHRSSAGTSASARDPPPPPQPQKASYTRSTNSNSTAPSSSRAAAPSNSFPSSAPRNPPSSISRASYERKQSNVSTNVGDDSLAPIGTSSSKSRQTRTRSPSLSPPPPSSKRYKRSPSSSSTSSTPPRRDPRRRSVSRTPLSEPSSDEEDKVPSTSSLMTRISSKSGSAQLSTESKTRLSGIPTGPRNGSNSPHPPHHPSSTNSNSTSSFQIQGPVIPSSSASSTPSSRSQPPPPTEPKAFREKLFIPSTSINSSTSASNHTAGDIPKGPKAGRFTAAGTGGVPTGPRGAQLKKFFPGESDTDSDQEKVGAGAGGKVSGPVKKEPEVKRGWVMDVDQRGPPPAPVGNGTPTGPKMDVEKAKEKEKAKEREREKSRERGKEKETERARNKEERERRENGTQNRRSPTPPSVPRGPQQRDSALHHTVALPPPTGPRSYERPTAPPPSLHPRPSSPKKPLPNEPARTDDHRSRPSHPPLSATSPPSTSEANSSAPASSIPTAAATPTTAIPPPSEAEPTAQPVLPPSGELYERLVQVGEGTYGKVYKARNVETGSLVALKRIRMEQERDGFPVTSVREIKLLQCLRHRNVVDLIEMMVSKGHVYMVFEYLDHDLTGVLHHPSINLTPAHLKSLMKQFLEGLGFIHRRGVLHRDLKGSNILLGRRGELKIADFGLARFYARGRQNDYTNRVITQWYKPPELLFGATVYGAEVDMWSAGCIFLELFSRRPIFQGQDEIHQLDVIFKITGTPKVDTWPGVQDLPWYELVKPKSEKDSELRSMFSKWLSPAGLDIAEALLSLNPANRPTADEALQMDYFFEDPQPEMPAVLADVKGEWHELESKRARKRQREEAGQP